MASTSLTGLYVHRVNSELPQVLERMKLLTSHTDLLVRMGSTKAIEPRDLLHCVSEAQKEAIQLQHQLTALAEMRSAVRRRHLGDDFGTFAAGYQGALKAIGKEFDKLTTSIRSLQAVATERINDPSRWGDAAAPGPLTDLLSFLAQLLELWGLLRVRNKVDA